MSLHFDQLFRKKLQKEPHFVKKHEKTSIWPILYNFLNKLPCLCISMNFSGKSCKKCLISWKSTKNHRSGKTLQLFEQSTMSLHFDELFRKKLQKVPHLVKKHEKPRTWPKHAIFPANYDVLAFSWTFHKEVGESASFREKPREIIDFAKTSNFSKKLPCFYVSMNFIAKSCKNCLISWKSTKTHRFGQNYATFSNKLPYFGVSMNFWAKGCKKLLNSWKSTKNHRFRQNFATFRTNYHVFAFRSTFQEKVAKSASFSEKARRIIHLAKTCNFSSKLPCLCISMNFSGKSCKKCLISWKSTKNHRFGQKLQVFEQTTMSWNFHELFSKEVQKVLHFVKKHEKSSIWPTLWNFWNKLPCFCISMNF